ncbi:MAG: hypothetical protein MZV63_41445 [Marinilabiliales bacterium]|nr:hypothetical protein [Marinilabiliales bacterium]
MNGSHWLVHQVFGNLRQFQIKPISITTVFDSRYDDSKSREGFYTYKYRGNDPLHADNVGLRMAIQDKTPLIYFLAVDKGYYLANFPVYVIGDDPKNLEVTIAVDEQKYLINLELNDSNQVDQS